VRQLLEHIPTLVSEEDNIVLFKEIEEEKVFQVIWGLDLAKAQGKMDCPSTFSEPAGPL
jgi:hypothetical protein